jgi:hypothetical protein
MELSDVRLGPLAPVSAPHPWSSEGKAVFPAADPSPAAFDGGGKGLVSERPPVKSKSESSLKFV